MSNRRSWSGVSCNYSQVLLLPPALLQRLFHAIFSVSRDSMAATIFGTNPKASNSLGCWLSFVHAQGAPFFVIPHLNSYVDRYMCPGKGFLCVNIGAQNSIDAC